jgi:hypothetical protein
MKFSTRNNAVAAMALMYNADPTNAASIRQLRGISSTAAKVEEEQHSGGGFQHFMSRLLNPANNGADLTAVVIRPATPNTPGTTTTAGTPPTAAVSVPAGSTGMTLQCRDGQIAALDADGEEWICYTPPTPAGMPAAGGTGGLMRGRDEDEDDADDEGGASPPVTMMVAGEDADDEDPEDGENGQRLTGGNMAVPTTINTCSVGQHIKFYPEDRAWRCVTPIGTGLGDGEDNERDEDDRDEDGMVVASAIAAPAPRPPAGFSCGANQVVKYMNEDNVWVCMTPGVGEGDDRR